LKFDPSNPNILYSGSWDCYVLVNDLREEKKVGDIFGPYICGESIDVRNNQLLVGGYKPDVYLSIYDLKTYSKMSDI
jgi:hypothetical protein